MSIARKLPEDENGVFRLASVWVPRAFYILIAFLEAYNIPGG